ncbi:MAG: hypothetical protein RIT25_3059 [Planctomycetota bacterium]
MLDRIIDLALRNRLLVMVLSAAIAIAGLYEAFRTPIDVLPDLDRPVVTVITEPHGMAPEDVEQLVTWPIEQVLNGVTGVQRVRSSSDAGLSVVHAEFAFGQDPWRARQIVAEKLALARTTLPAHAEPVLAPLSSIMGQVQVVGFRGKGSPMDPVALRLMVDRDVRPRIRSIPGVAQVMVVGGQPTELQVLADAGRLQAHGVALHELRDAVTRSNAMASPGVLEVGSKGPNVVVPALLKKPEELAEAIVRTEGEKVVRVRDVAEVTLGPAGYRVGDAGVDGQPGVLMILSKQPGTDTVELTRAVNEELQRIRTELPADIEIVDDVFQQAAFIHRAIDNVLVAVRDGTILVILVLMLFLANIRTTIITLTAIPLSVAITAIVFDVAGLTINTMTLGGLAVAIGTLVDDAIVDVENVFRRLHQNSLRPEAERKPILQVVYEASCEVRKPVVYGTLLVTVVYLPLFFLTGIEGRLFLPVAIAFLTSVFASLLVAMTVTPVMCSLMLGRGKVAHPEYGSRFVRWLQDRIEFPIRLGIDKPMQVIGVLLAFTICSGVVLLNRGSSFLPAFQEGSAQVNLFLPPDTGITTSSQYGQRLESVLSNVEGVRTVGRRTGRAAGDDHIMPVNVSEAIVTFDPETERSREEILEDIRERVGDAFPGMPTETEQPLAHLISHMLSGVTAQVSVQVSGPDLAVLRRFAARVEDAIRPVPGVRDLFTEQLTLVDQIAVKPKRDVLARAGIDVQQLADTVELALGSEPVARMRVGQLQQGIAVRLRPEDRASVQQLAALVLHGADGSLWRVGDVADVVVEKAPNSIQRTAGQRRIMVQHNIADRSLGEVVGDVDRALEPVRAELAQFPGYSIRIGGQYEAQAEASRMIALFGGLALGLMVLILYLQFQSLLVAGLVMASLPMAFLGAVAALVVTGQDLSIAALVGLIALLGMAARNAILLIDNYIHLMRDEGLPFTAETLVRAGRERMVPVLMTALASGIGLLPLALSPGAPGRELLYPVATVIVGGLVSSTLLDFLVTPALFWALCRREAARLCARPVEPSGS